MWLIFSRRDADRAANVLPDERPGGEDKAQEERHKSGALDRDCIVFFVEGRGPGSRRRKSRPSGQASREGESKDGDFVVPILIVEKAPGGESPEANSLPQKITDFLAFRQSFMGGGKSRWPRKKTLFPWGTVSVEEDFGQKSGRGREGSGSPCMSFHGGCFPESVPVNGEGGRVSEKLLHVPIFDFCMGFA